LSPALAETRIAPCLTPHGRLVLVAQEDAASLDAQLAERLTVAFSRGPGHGLLRLGAGEMGQAMPPAFGYWREFAARFVTGLCTQTEPDEHAAPVPALAAGELAELALCGPAMAGAEYLTPAVLAALWDELAHAFALELKESGAAVQDFLKRLNPAWNLVGRVHFNLAENRKDAASPFAFLATYTSRLSSHGKAQHLPLGQALREFAGATNKQRLLSLLLPVQRAAETCAWLRQMVDAGEIFHPVRFTPEEAFRLLNDAAALESAGIVLRMPVGWKANRPPRPQVTAMVGGKPAVGVGQEALLDFQVQVTLDGEPLTEAELRRLLDASSGLAMMRGRWVEIDRERLQAMLEQYRKAEQLAARGRMTFAEAMRLLSGADAANSDVVTDADHEWSRVVAGPWLADLLKGLRQPEGLACIEPGRALHGTLRPYQEVGVRWLRLLSKLGLGACLADDMGLGKTIQVLALLLVHKTEKDEPQRPSLLVAPASLLANWASEIERFAPSVKALVAHPSAMPAAELKALPAERLASLDLVITSYGSLLRLPWIASTRWRLVVIDEAQAIKNPGAKQTRAVKSLNGDARIALTGTPVENRLSDLWSIFDFINPGLLGSAKTFASYTKSLEDKPHNPYGPLRDLVRPYILRRLKTDKSVIADLPDKTEIKAYCPLSRKQAALYEQTVRELARHLAQSEGIKRKGLVLSSLMRLKQICNHPSQWLGDGEWAEDDSGKWARLRDIAEVIAAKQEKMLVFSQFREVTEPLSAFLGGLFGRPGLVLHGETAVAKRKDLVRRFQEDERVPFFVLSLKAGGSGLNLTAAAHVIHFDRWWNPAVENQATDRAFRIGQTKNVLVHKFVCRGTVEEKIDALIESKRQLANDLLEGGGEINLTELDDSQLLKLVALDINAALKE